MSWKGLEEKGWKYILSPIVEAIMGLIFPVPPYPTLHSNIYTSHNIHADNIGINSIISTPEIGSTWIHYLVLMKKKGESGRSQVGQQSPCLIRSRYLLKEWIIFIPTRIFTARTSFKKRSLKTIDPRHGL